MINLSEDETKKESKLKRLQEKIQEKTREIKELKKLVNTNYHHVLLKIWGKAIIILFLFVGVAFIMAYLAYLSYIPAPQITIEKSKIEDIAKTVFTATMTLNGLIIGFLPVVVFFYVKEIKEEQQFIEREKVEEIEECEVLEDSKNRGRYIQVFDWYYTLLSTFKQNLRSGVLNYLKTYLFVSLLLLFYLLLLYNYMILNNLAPLFMLIDVIFLMISLTGIFPIVYIALTAPTYRIVRYIVPEKIIEAVEPVL